MASRLFDDDTIAAVATPPGEGGIGTIRLSGREALRIADAAFRSRSGKPVAEQKHFTARVGRLLSADGVRLDEALVLVMRAPKSYTREDVVELSVHGGPAVLAETLARVLALGARAAEPGEFTKRAFLNGRIDLVQAEAVLDLIQAKTSLARRWASSRLEGSLSADLQDLKTRLVGLLSHLEASIDFPEDQPDAMASSEAAAALDAMAARVQAFLDSAAMGLLARRGLRAVLAGRPNVGKSSLLNRLAGTDRVIVTPYPGTTRDVVEEEVSVGGFPVRFADTAGIQETDHPIEKEGIDRSRKALAGADLALIVLDASAPLGDADRALLDQTAGRPAILVANKSDLPAKWDVSLVGRERGLPAVRASAVREGGTRELENEISNFITGGKAVISDEHVVSSVRQKDLLEKTLQSLKEAASACRKDLSPEFIAADVRAALDALGRLVGEVVTDDVLEVLFSRFCIGK
ncbi:MAG TPA: tRNA uridine-5-carboxymethylaminomethyl(34) synthesis GTPase MnmE [Candidatus Eisenbacteria bacterium]|nr:tRNA uridine-5-carboxymethylaminomethyl(34) synthesis GTPase MnmE [Candidatus Eisenbacteria bacterium]